MIKVMRLDWSAMKYYQKRFLVIPISLFIVGWHSTIFLIPMGTFLCFLCSVDVFAVEEKGDLNRLYLTLPIERKAIVTGRYLLSFLFAACGMLLGGVLMPLANKVSLSKWYLDGKWLFAIISFSMLAFALMTLFMYPMLFKLGYQKGKLWGLYLPLVVFGGLYIALMEYPLISGNAAFITDLLIYASEHMLQAGGGMLGMAAAVLAVSWMLSLRIYEKREF